jgi:hypothetical protein
MVDLPFNLDNISAEITLHGGEETMQQPPEVTMFLYDAAVTEVVDPESCQRQTVLLNLLPNAKRRGRDLTKLTLVGLRRKQKVGIISPGG